MSARTIGLIGTPARSAIPALIASLDDLDTTVFMWTCIALGQFGEDAKAAVPKLSGFAAREDSAARWAIEALAEMGTNAVPGLVEVYHDSAKRNRHFAAKALMKLGTEVSTR